MHNLLDIFCLHDSEMPSIHLDVAVESQFDGDSAAAHLHLTELFLDEFKMLPIGRDSRTLFKFTCIPKMKVDNKELDFVENPIVKDIFNNSLTFSNPKKFNDPMDPILWNWLKIQKRNEPNRVERKIFKMEEKIVSKNVRMCCLADPISHLRNNRHSSTSIDNCSPLMWAHYANSHKGICIEYEVTPETISTHNDDCHVLRMCDVRYRGHKIMSDYIDLDNALLAKGECWEYENETRLIYYTTHSSEWKDDRGNKKDYISLPGFRVKGVYMGYRISEKESISLQNFLKNRNIPLYKMEFSMDDITKLVPVRIL